MRIGPERNRESASSRTRVPWKLSRIWKIGETVEALEATKAL
jgi:hypothetical protein